MGRIGYSWNPFDAYSRRAMQRRGKTDAMVGVPLPGSDQLPPAEADLRAAGSHDLGILERDFTEADEKLHSVYRTAVDEHRQSQAELARVEEEHQAARDRYEEHHGQLAPRTTSRTHRAYFAALSVLAAIELPVNKAAFALLRDNVLLTWAAAAGVGIILLGSAHVIGGLVRNVRQWMWNQIILSLSLLTGAAATIYATAVLRRSYLLVHGADGLDPDTAFWVFAAFNAGLFFLGTALSYRVHRKWSGEVARTGRIVSRARKRLEARGESRSARSHAPGAGVRERTSPRSCATRGGQLARGGLPRSQPPRPNRPRRPLWQLPRLLYDAAHPWLASGARRVEVGHPTRSRARRRGNAGGCPRRASYR